MEHIYDMIVIGGGPAGCTAALYAARAGLDTLILERMSVGGQMAVTGTIDNYPGFEEGIDGFTLGMKMQSSAERFHASTTYAEVTALDSLEEPVKHIVTTDGVLSTRTIVIAAGANPRKLGLDEEDGLIGRGVHYCAHCDGRFYKGKTVAVVGGGNTAVADALYLSRLANKVIFIHRRDTLRAEKVYVTPLMKTANVEFHWNSTISEILSDDGVTGIRLIHRQTGEETELACDGVFVSVGRIPATDFLKDSGVRLDGSGYIVADETTKTTVPGVFAAGDVRTKILRQVVTAVSDGAMAAHCAEEYLNERL